MSPRSQHVWSFLNSYKLRDTYLMYGFIIGEIVDVERAVHCSRIGYDDGRHISMIDRNRCENEVLDDLIDSQDKLSFNHCAERADQFQHNPVTDQAAASFA